ncbi:MAG: AbrB/MazE/SpoVT family DNA-binding domain-containing protein [Candidatus Sumerlaeota bacterium]|nr:AbrB/MazE/SpoVT family DNA-binding domain-containing protein [Candidatus Sumerlaeota bacterium]
MGNVVKARIVQIGNSRGIRIPKVWLDQLQFGEEIQMAIEPDQIVIRPAHRPRETWAAAFQAMARRGEDRMLDEPIVSKWDEEEWEW